MRLEQAGAGDPDAVQVRFDYDGGANALGNTMCRQEGQRLVDAINAAGRFVPRAIEAPQSEVRTRQPVARSVPPAVPLPLSSESAIALVIANAVPLLGVLFFGWGLGDIMVFYWVESGVIAFYTVLKIAKVGKLAARRFLSATSVLRYTPRHMKRSIYLLVGIVAIVAAAYSETRGAQAPAAPDPADLAEGLRLYQQKADCRACHGWSADGVKGDNQMPDGPNLREKKYTRELLVLTIKCGRPNTQMPAFDKFAYTDGRCFMMTAADLAKNPTRMPDPPATLQPREIDLIADFLMAKVVGKGPMDSAKCVEFWGSEAAVCKDLKK